jgi:hypothetical protein
MSVHLVERRRTNDTGYDVRWRDPATGANMSRRFEDSEEADAFDAAMKARLALDRAKIAYAAIADHWRQAVDEELAA